ncbi:MAG: hypothetical protein AAGI91_11880 [Bacteroidota bacterium]
MNEPENVFARKELDRLSSLLKEYNDKLRSSLDESAASDSADLLQNGMEFRSMYELYDMLQRYASDVLDRYEVGPSSSAWLEARVRLIELRGLLNRIERKSSVFSPVQAIPLLKEYTQWMASGIDRLSRFLDGDPRRPALSDSSAEAVATRFRNLRGPLINLARSVSQSIEHSDIKESTRIELALRLADFESMIEVLSNQSSRFH